MHTYVQVVDAPLDQVYAWHARPGAIHRLAPPWMPVTITEEAGSLADGRAVLRLPLGLRWVAQHRPSGEPYVFCDELTSLPFPWRHTHRFEAVGEQTRITDTVETPAPEAFVRSMFAYRHAQLADDLAAHRWASSFVNKTIAVTGASGLVGSALVPFLSAGGHRVIRLARGAAPGLDERRWDPARPDAAMLEGVDAVVHLAGASIAGRFTEAHKRAVRESRVGPTRELAAAAARAGVRTLVVASAIGYYGAEHGDELLTEDSAAGDDFLAGVVRDWEAAADPAREAGLRVVHVRTGIVQSPRGGVLKQLRPLFAAGLGGRVGDGRQWLSWVSIDDAVGIYHRALADDALAGPVNAVAPLPVRNAEYTATLARVLRRPALLPVPAFGPRLLLGAEGARELAYASQRVASTRLGGYPFRQPGLETALRHLLGRARDGA